MAKDIPEEEIPKLISDQEMAWLEKTMPEKIAQEIKLLSYELSGMMRRKDYDGIHALRKRLRQKLSDAHALTDKVKSITRRASKESKDGFLKLRMEGHLKERLAERAEKKNTETLSIKGFPIPKTREVNPKEGRQDDKTVIKTEEVAIKEPILEKPPSPPTPAKTKRKPKEQAVPRKDFTAPEKKGIVVDPLKETGKAQFYKGKATEEAAIPKKAKKDVLARKKKKKTSHEPEKEALEDLKVVENEAKYITPKGQKSEDRFSRIQEYIDKDQRKGSHIDIREGKGSIEGNESNEDEDFGI